MQSGDLAERRAQQRDVSALIGMLAVLEGELWGEPGSIGELPDWAEHLAARLSRDGLVAPNPSRLQLRQALNDLNHRLRYALGEYDEPPAPLPLPE